MSMQFIRLSTGTAEEGGTLIKNLQLDPSAEWPPPEHLWVVTPHSDPDRLQLWFNLEPADMLAESMPPDYDLRYTATPLRRTSCSRLDDDAVAEGGFVARGAEYVPMSEEPS